MSAKPLLIAIPRCQAHGLAVLSEEERGLGIVERSSGNHGLAIAYCCGILDTHAVVVAPTSAPNAKIQKIRAYGDEVILIDDIHALARVSDEFTQTQRHVFLPPADDPWVVADAGTVGREIVCEAASMGAVLDSLLGLLFRRRFDVWLRPRAQRVVARHRDVCRRTDRFRTDGEVDYPGSPRQQ